MSDAVVPQPAEPSASRRALRQRLVRPCRRQRPVLFVPPLEADDGRRHRDRAVLPAGDTGAASRRAEPVRPGAAAIDEFADLAAMDRRRPEPVPARHRRTGPRRVFRHPLRPAHFAHGRPARRPVLRHARHHARPDRRLCRRRGRRTDHANCRRAAHLPRHPDRAAGQRRRQVGVRQPARRHEHAGRSGVRDRL